MLCLECIKFEMPSRYSSRDVDFSVEYMNLEHKGVA